MAVAVRQDPQQCCFIRLRLRMPCHLAVQSTFAKLRLALWIEAQILAVLFDRFEDRADCFEGILELVRLHEVRIVGRRVVLGVLPVWRPRKASDTKIEAWRTELAFVIAVGMEFDHPARPARRAQHMCSGTIDNSIAATALLVGDRTGVSNP